MQNITISIEAEMLAKVKRYAASRGVSVNALIKNLLKKEIGEDDQDWLERFFERADRLRLSSGDGRPMTREEIYNR